jgi:hypothetical protein
MAIKNSMPTIPAIEDPILRDAVSSLCRAAGVFQKCFVNVCEGTTPEELLEKYPDILLEAERVIEAWQDHLGHTVEDIEEDC